MYAVVRELWDLLPLQTFHIGDLFFLQSYVPTEWKPALNSVPIAWQSEIFSPCRFSWKIVLLSSSILTKLQNPYSVLHWYSLLYLYIQIWLKTMLLFPFLVHNLRNYLDSAKYKISYAITKTATELRCRIYFSSKHLFNEAIHRRFKRVFLHMKCYYRIHIEKFSSSIWLDPWL